MIKEKNWRTLNAFVHLFIRSNIYKSWLIQLGADQSFSFKYFFTLSWSKTFLYRLASIVFFLSQRAFNPSSQSKNRIYLRAQLYFFMKNFQQSKFINCFLWVGSCWQFCCRLSHVARKDVIQVRHWQICRAIVLKRTTWKIDGLVRKPLWIRHGLFHSFESIRNSILQFHQSFRLHILCVYTRAGHMYTYICTYIMFKIKQIL